MHRGPDARNLTEGRDVPLGGGVGSRVTAVSGIQRSLGESKGIRNICGEGLTVGGREHDSPFKVGDVLVAVRARDFNNLQNEIVSEGPVSGGDMLHQNAHNLLEILPRHLLKEMVEICNDGEGNGSG